MELATLASEVGMKEFTHRYNLMKCLLRNIWTSGGLVVILLFVNKILLV